MTTHPRCRLVAAVCALLAVASLGACKTATANDTRDATAGLPNLQQDLAAHTWRLDAADSSPNPHATTDVTIEFGTDTVSGQGPCNRYNGHLAVDDDDQTVTITNIASTFIACDPDVSAAEHAYLSTLEKVHDVDLSDGYDERRLVLSDEAGDRLSYEAVEPPH
jgi:heat shock protein HslJ